MVEPTSRIMIVDDERLNINVLNAILKDKYLIKVAMNGEEALKRSLTHPRPDMILLDIQMPGMTGYYVCEQLKKNPLTCNIPVIFITALTDEEDEKKGLIMGAVDYVTKPLRPSIILARIETHLRLKQAQEALVERNAELERALELREAIEHISRHDLKTPLNGILGVTQILSAESYLLPEHKELIKLQERSGYKMLEMINRSLDMLKMETGNYQLNPQPVDLVQIVQRILREMQHTSVNLLLYKHPISSEQAFIIQGEELLCYSMLANLLKNAMEASAGNETIIVAMDEKEQRYITIQNSGVVPQAVRERFFEKYVTTGKTSGTGLGTYSAKLIAETMGGHITMTTSEERGTVVSVFFP